MNATSIMLSPKVFAFVGDDPMTLSLKSEVPSLSESCNVSILVHLSVGGVT